MLNAEPFENEEENLYLYALGLGFELDFGPGPYIRNYFIILN